MSNRSNSPAIVQVMDSLGERRGGLTKAVFDRLHLFAETHRVYLLTVANQENGRTIFDRLQRHGAIPHGTEYRSFHEESRKVWLPGAKTALSHLVWEADANVTAVPDGKTLTRYYLEGSFIGLAAKNPVGQIKYIDVHESGKPWMLKYREKASIQDGTERIALREYFDDDNNARFRIYYNSGGVPYMSTWVTQGNYEYRTTYWPQENPKTLKDARAANAIWLERMLKTFDSSIVYFDEPRTSFASALRLQNTKIVAPIHTTHRAVAGQPKLKPWVKHYADNKNNIDEFVVLTDSQRCHLVEDLKIDSHKVQVIPHSAPEANHSRVPSTRARKSLVIVSRLAQEKKIDHAISAFASVAAENPEYFLEIYGTGPEEVRLNSLISELGMRDRVVLHGRTENPLEAFARASASIVTSEFEGFGLVILESMSQGTPVVGYKTEYGPAELITTENGITVANNDVVALSDALNRLLRDDSYRKDLSCGALATAEKFNISAWREAWLATSRLSSEGYKR